MALPLTRWGHWTPMSMAGSCAGFWAHWRRGDCAAVWRAGLVAARERESYLLAAAAAVHGEAAEIGHLAELL